MHGRLQENLYPKYFNEWLDFRPSASCFAPSAVMLLLPSLKENRQARLSFLLYYTDRSSY